MATEIITNDKNECIKDLLIALEKKQIIGIKIDDGCSKEWNGTETKYNIVDNLLHNYIIFIKKITKSADKLFHNSNNYRIVIKKNYDGYTQKLIINIITTAPPI
jgi:hypothetical protein